MSMLSNKHFWLGIGVVGALGLWFWLTPVADQGGGSGDNRAAHEDVAAQEDVTTPADGGLAKRAVVAEGPGEGRDDEAWNPGGEDEPTVEDVQHWDWLDVDLDRLIDETRPKARKRLDAGEFTKEYFKASLEYLKLDEEERKRFETAVQAGLTAIDEARKKMEDVRAATKYDETEPDSVRVWKNTQAEFLARQKKAANGLVESLPTRRRTTLMREEALTWIVRYDFGIRHANRDPSR